MTTTPLNQIEQKRINRAWLEAAREVDVGIQCGAISAVDRPHVIAQVYAVLRMMGMSTPLRVEDLLP